MNHAPLVRSRTRPADSPPRIATHISHAYLVLAAGLLGAALFEAVSHGSWWAFAAGLLGPDLALLLGGGKGLAPGQLHPRAVSAYNAVHRFWGPAALVAAGVLVPAAGALVGGLAWGTHVALDRGVGYTLRTREGFLRS